MPSAICTDQKFGRMASEYLAFLLTSFPGLETETNPQKPRRGAFNIRYSVILSTGLLYYVYRKGSKKKSLISKGLKYYD